MNEARIYAKHLAAACISIAAAFLIQMTLGPWIRLGTAVPNLMIVVTATYGLLLGKVPGMLAGFACGLLLDCADPSMFGMHTLLYMLTGYLNGSFRRFFFGDGMRLPLVLIGVSDLLYGLVFYLGRQFLQREGSIGFFLRHLILPEVVYTLLAGVFAYSILFRLIRWAQQTPRRN